MVLSRYLSFSAIALSFFFMAPALAQESAFFNTDIFSGNKQAIRYEEALGVFHYVVPCKQRLEDDRFATETAICWPVNATRFRMIEGKLDISRAFQGTLTVSATRIRFIPQLQADMEFYVEVPVAGVKFSVDLVKSAAILQSADKGYRFGFLNFCVKCKPDAPLIDSTKSAQMATEFSNIAESFTHFDTIYSTVRDAALHVRVVIAPENQPKPADNPAAMGLYGSLNHRLADSCPQAARACIQQYAAYQTCQASSPNASCAPPPSCTAVCPLLPATIQSMQAAVCESSTRDSAAIFPWWTEVLKREEIDHPSPPLSGVLGGVMGGVAGMGSMMGGAKPLPGWGSIYAMSGGSPAMIDLSIPTAGSDNSCSVAQIYKQSKESYLRTLVVKVPPPPQWQQPKTPTAFGLPVDRVHVGSGTMQGNLVTRINPAYPAIAKAAHISGAVILHAIIDKKGNVHDLTVVDGPPLLIQSAVDAVKQWKYKPFLESGKPVEVDTTITVNFMFGNATASDTSPQPLN